MHFAMKTTFSITGFFDHVIVQQKGWVSPSSLSRHSVISEHLCKNTFHAAVSQASRYGIVSVPTGSKQESTKATERRPDGGSQPTAHPLEMMHDSRAGREFLGLDLCRDHPAEETRMLRLIPRFRHLIE